MESFQTDGYTTTNGGLDWEIYECYLIRLYLIYIKKKQYDPKDDHILSPRYVKNKVINETIKQHPKETLAIFLGLEGSAWLHLLQDGDPIPRGWLGRRHK